MERELKLTLWICVVLASTGCAENGAAPGGGGAGGSAGTGGSAGASGTSGQVGGGIPGTPALDPLDTTARYAVLSTDFSSSSIAMLDADFVPIDESWLNSGSTYPGLVATLSGDVVLPNRQAGDGTFAVIDRFSTDVVTRFYVPSGNLDGQVRTHGDIGDSGFSSNPQDFIFVDEQSAWVPRYESNLDPSAPPENQGNDLFEINPSDMSATGDRIDLSSLDTTADVMTPSGPAPVEVLARPSRGLAFGSTVVVGLDRISAGFDAAGPGMVAVVELDSRAVTGLELAGLESCGNVVPVPGTPSKLVVACVGFSQPYGDEAQLRASSGIALLSVDGSEVTVERVWRAANHPGSAIAVNSVIAIDPQRVLGVANGDFDATTDALYLIDLTTGMQELVYESAGSFVLGVSAYDPVSEILYVPDASENAVLEFASDPSGFITLGATEIAPSLGLPPSKVYLLE